MLPPGVEARPDLQVTGEVLAFGFCGESAVGDRAAALLSEELLDHVLQAVAETPTRFVVVDMRNVRNLSSAGLGHVLALRRRLQPVPWKMVLLLGDPVLRGVVSATGLGQSFSIVSDEAELRGLLNGGMPGGAAPARTGEPDLSFNQEELEAMEREGITLDDAIRAVEALRE